MKVLVAGATGVLGGEIVRRLKTKGHAVRAIKRAASNPERVAALKSAGVEFIQADLKDRPSLDRACTGMDAVISTVTAILANQPDDNLQSVDLNGQKSLIDAARAAGVGQFVYISLSVHGDFPLEGAKRAVEAHLKRSGLVYTILQPTFFTEYWLGPGVGFDHEAGTVTIYGSGNQKISFISFRDVAEFAVQSLENPAARNKESLLGGPDQVSPLEAVKIFEQASGRRFEVRHVSDDALRAQRAGAQNPVQQSFAALMLANAHGDPIDMQQTLKSFSVGLSSVNDCAKRDSAGCSILTVVGGAMTLTCA